MSAQQDIEQLLTEAGMEFTVVARCPDARCELCNQKDIPAAA